jgi:amidohydrolase
MSQLKNLVQAQAQAIFGQVLELRRHLHAHPELSFEEAQTSAHLAQMLQSAGIPFQAGVAGHGIVALIKGDLPGDKVIALRGDMDALPIHEANDVPYRSKNPGVMHACGHDVHSASVMGAALILNQLKAYFGGTVKILFQPAEEKLPGGASLMIKAGALENPSPSAILGQHVYTPIEAGKIGIRSGMYMASADEIYVTVKGQGGHGAVPQDCVDPVLVSAHLIVALQQIVSRNANPTIPSVLSFGKVEANGATNIIPYEVKMEGTFRTMDEAWRSKAHQRMKQLAETLCESMGATCEFRIEKGYPTLFNHEGLTQDVRSLAEAYLGPENVEELPIRMTAEDFAYYSQVMPASFWRLGTGNKAKGITSPVHTNTFDVDESSLEVGSGLMAWLAINYLVR